MAIEWVEIKSGEYEVSGILGLDIRAERKVQMSHFSNGQET